MERKDIKLNNIVVVKTGIAWGNKKGTITHVTKLKTHRHDLVCCAAQNVVHASDYNNECGTKTRSWFEDVSDLRLATPEERKLYAQGITKISE